MQSRRDFLRGAVVFGGAVAGALNLIPGAGRRAGFGLNLSQPGRPVITHGVQSGDVTDRTAVVWARADRPARMWVETAATESFAQSHLVGGPVVGADRDFTGKVALDRLPSGQDVFYRVQFEAEDAPGVLSEPVIGRLRTAPDSREDVSFVWSGDTCGQGWGINPDFGGFRIYETMRTLVPGFLLHCGDNIYADGPIESTLYLADGTAWRNVTTEEKSKVAETLAEFRGNYKYNLGDHNVRALNAEVALMALWDDHETVNNWWPGEVLNDPRYQVREVDVLATRARQAFHEFMPTGAIPNEEGRVYRVLRHGPHLDLFLLDMRSHRGANSSNDQPSPGPGAALLGRPQLDWLKRELAASRATWKVVAADLPLGLVIGDENSTYEAVANRRDGTPLGREHEIAELLSFMRRRKVDNVVWLTADVHYTAAHRYEPDGAAFTDFNPFWEFVSGPLQAGTFGPKVLDPTFGPRVVFQKAAETPNQPPSDGLQFFGHVQIDGPTGVMTVRLKDLAGAELYTVALTPE